MTYMKKVPSGQKPEDFIAEVNARATIQMAEGDLEGFELYTGIEVVLKFDQLWEEQENLKRTEEVRARYLQLAKEGRVLVLEIDE